MVPQGLVWSIRLHWLNREGRAILLKAKKNRPDESRIKGTADRLCGPLASGVHVRHDSSPIAHRD
jgi:hypothetical protein